MPKIDCSFKGYVLGMIIDKAIDEEGQEICVEHLTSEELASKLSRGDFTLPPNLAFLYECDYIEINLNEYSSTPNLERRIDS